MPTRPTTGTTLYIYHKLPYFCNNLLYSYWQQPSKALVPSVAIAYHGHSEPVGRAGFKVWAYVASLYEFGGVARQRGADVAPMRSRSAFRFLPVWDGCTMRHCRWTGHFAKDEADHRR